MPSPTIPVLDKYNGIGLFHATGPNSFKINPKFPILSNDQDVEEFNCAVNTVFLNVGNGQRGAVAFNDETFFSFVDTAEPELMSRAVATLKEIALDLCTARGVTEGGDERLMLTAKATNKYHCSPIPPKETLIRCSCTGSSPSSLGFETARSKLESLWKGEVTVNDLLMDVRIRIKQTLPLKQDYHVVLFPSGSDAEYLPLHMAIRRGRRLGNMTGIVNIVAAKGEVGSGTPGAAGGLHFDKYTPCGDVVKANESADGLGDSTQVLVKQLMAREIDGSLHSNFNDVMESTVKAVMDEDSDRLVIVHSVEGTKTGLCLPSLDCLRSLTAKYGDRILPVVDACQFRCDKDAIDDALAAKAVVLITGSKFFGGPAFCGAVLIPESIVADLDNSDVPAGLGQYLSKYEIPTELPHLRSNLPEWNNFGLSLRWSAAVAEMEDFMKQPDAQSLINQWVNGVKTAMASDADSTIEVVEDLADKTTQRIGDINSIVSFKVKRGSAQGKPLNATELKELYSWLSVDSSALLGDKATEAEREACRVRVMTGQPVPVCEAFGVLRLAVGAPMVRDLAKRGAVECLKDDVSIIRKIHTLGKHYDLCLANSKAGAKAAATGISTFPWSVLANVASVDRREELAVA